MRISDWSSDVCSSDLLDSPETVRLVDTAVKDHFDHWLAAAPERARSLLDFAIERAEERQRKRQEKDLDRKSATRKLRLPGKLTDCTRSAAARSEEHTSELQSLMRISYAVFCLKKKKHKQNPTSNSLQHLVR